jgi:hypothetical protein
MARTIKDRFGRDVRLTSEREAHILRHPELRRQIGKLEAVLQDPDVIVRSIRDPDVHLYHKHYAETPVTEKYLLVAVKVREKDSFIITAFFTDAVKKGETIWEK